MFYQKQSSLDRKLYKEMLAIIGSLSNLFSENQAPYLAYRAHENIFCKYFKADNLSRVDCSADAKKGNIGIGLKTWVGRDDQKIAEFGKLRHVYKDLKGLSLAKKISEYRNERIRITKNLYDINALIYHVVKRIPGSMQIFEYAFEEVDIDNINIISGRGNQNNTYFTDNKHVYHFSASKNTLYMLFNNIEVLDEFEVEIMKDPFDYLQNINQIVKVPPIILDKSKEDKICLRLYSQRKNSEKIVYEKSGLNQWNAGGRARNPNELYIPYPAEDRLKTEGFFPPRETIFKLILPNDKVISAKVCQSDGKAIMSNPNKVLGEWLLRKVFELKEGTIVTYQMLEKFGVDSVIFTKKSDLVYTIDFSEVGTYEAFYQD